MKHLLMISFLISGCSVFGAPKVGSQCFEWCLTVSIDVLPGTPAICYSTEAKMLEAKRSLEAKGITVQVRK